MVIFVSFVDWSGSVFAEPFARETQLLLETYSKVAFISVYF